MYRLPDLAVLKITPLMAILGGSDKEASLKASLHHPVRRMVKPHHFQSVRFQVALTSI